MTSDGTAGLGLSGGGNGRARSQGSGNAGSGTPNTGGGGGSHPGQFITGDAGSGGSGVVILRLLTSQYSGITTGSPTVTTDGSHTVLTYTSSGTYTA